MDLKQRKRTSENTVQSMSLPVITLASEGQVFLSPTGGSRSYGLFFFGSLEKQTYRASEPKASSSSSSPVIPRHTPSPDSPQDNLDEAMWTKRFIKECKGKGQFK